MVALIKSSIEKCIPHSTATDISDIIKIVQEGGIKEDDDFQKLVHCAYQASGYANEDGTVIIEKASNVYPDPSAIKEVMEKCNRKVGTSVENTFYFFKCLQITAPLLLDFE